MRTYYIVNRDVALAGGKNFREFHFIDLDGRKVLLSAEADSHGHEKFQRNVTAEPLPDVDDPSPIQDRHVDRLTVLGVKRGDKTRDLVRIARSRHRLM